MAKATNAGLIGGTNAASASNPNGVYANGGYRPGAVSSSAQTNNPYPGGLNTNFDTTRAYIPPYLSNMGGYDAYACNGGLGTHASENGNGQDNDVNQAASLARNLRDQDPGMDTAATSALLNMYEGRIGEKNSLAEQIAGSDDQLTRQQDLNKAAAGSAVGEGLRNTRNNFNDRGLLYSGARQGGESAVRAAGASQLASSVAGTARDASNSKTAAQNAYASVDLASQQDTLKRANDAFDTASANNIARLQAYQQLAGGIGSAAGSIAGSKSSSGPSYQNPASGWNPNASSLTADGSFSQPQMGSQYSPNTNYGLLGGNQSLTATGR